MTTVTCEECEELLAAYALRALTDDERADVEAHLATCEQHPDAPSLRAVGAALVLAGEEREPPADLFDRIRRGIEASDEAPVEAPERAPVPIGRGTRRWAPLAAIAAALLLVSIGLWQGGFGPLGSERPIERAATMGAIEGQLAYRPGAGTIEVTLRGVESPPSERAYQAWVIRPGSAPEPAGLFHIDARVGTVTIRSSLAVGDTVAVTLEPSGGSQAPTSSPIFALQY